MCDGAVSPLDPPHPPNLTQRVTTHSAVAHLMPTYEQARGSSRERGYTSRWDKASATFKQHHPLCRGCLALGKQVPTEVVDHVVPHKGNQAIFWDSSKWQSACRWHHDVIKPRLEALLAVGEVEAASLWLDSPVSIALSRKHPMRQAIGADGWPTG